MGGGSLMVWLAVGYGGRTSLVFLNGRQKYTDYIQVLNASDMGGEEWKFQQDGASIHTATGVKDWFLTNNVDVLQWPAKSPDLNIVENIWAMLVRRFYADGRQFDSQTQLREALNDSWDNFCQTEIQTLYNSLPNRIFEVIKANGKTIPY
ncbi:Transposable element Tc3 transposase like protein [Argiope bruennichi]|uniref:Transposable element Tc3 transposase like protein n=1 Tax=Argiope bruennichi TaxID=94029 RepID=A0A8T0FYJ3_ARGBR|nr:Transposable element Tc3 transposase like protein [Argiope bruennichi]